MSFSSSKRDETATSGALRVSVVYLTVCAIWIVGSDRVVARLALSSERAAELQTIKGLAFILATAALLFFVVRRHSQMVHAAHAARLEGSLELTRRLAMAIEIRDAGTGQHASRIGLYARAVGRELGLDQDRLDLLERAAPLHDVGKIAIPDAILNKPGPLDEEEILLMRTHVEIGRTLLESDSDEFLRLASTIAGTHHESWDGGGYPLGLAGDRIPLEGRIVAVCDVFDALLSDRSYKDPWPFSLAVEEIVRLSATKFDPGVVDAFSRALPCLEAIHHGAEDGAAVRPAAASLPEFAG